ncbi:MAG: helix-turn-helix domain-containing protein [Bacteroidales bacterium]|jgi:DNA-binding transcriptional MerR regulator|nr:helix-turn-helix domain-containing protein [Bacteroidales bacterium]
MYIDKENFDAWMERIWEKLESIENRISGKEKTRHTINGERLYDNQDLCFMFNISKRTLQRFRSSGLLPYRKISQKLYYLESEVLIFIKDHLKSGGKQAK